MKRIVLFTGAFGSGKTEIAMQYALVQKQTHEQTVLVDLDLINPYFNVAAHTQALNAAGIETVVPHNAHNAAEIRTLTGRIGAVYRNRAAFGVTDLGGESAGAAVAGSLKNAIEDGGGAELWFCLNPFRPQTATTEDALAVVREVEAATRRQITGIVNNANMAFETAPEHLMAGEEAALALAKACCVPLVMHAGMQEIIAACGPLSGTPLVLTPANHPAWQWS